MTRNELTAQVALRMDEVTPVEELQITVDGSDNNPLYTLIDGILDDCVLELFTIAPYWRLPYTPFSGTQLSKIFPERDDSRYMIRLRLEDNFLRLAYVSHALFQRPITEVYPEQSAEGKRQHNRYLMGREAKPVAVLSIGSWSADGEPPRTVQRKEIDCYSLPSQEDGDVKAFYIAKPDAIEDNNQSAVENVVPETIIPALEWLIAARAFGARGDVNHSEICQQNAQNLLV